jgi:hypothetical protein
MSDAIIVVLVVASITYSIVTWRRGRHEPSIDDPGPWPVDDSRDGLRRTQNDTLHSTGDILSERAFDSTTDQPIGED